jgi:hypothetical protein
MGTLSRHAERLNMRASSTRVHMALHMLQPEPPSCEGRDDTAPVVQRNMSPTVWLYSLQNKKQCGFNRNQI